MIELNWSPEQRDYWGKIVRNAWVRWARSQPMPKDSHLREYHQLAESEKEVDRQIAEAVIGQRIANHPTSVDLNAEELSLILNWCEHRLQDMQENSASVPPSRLSQLVFQNQKLRLTMLQAKLRTHLEAAIAGNKKP